MNIGAPESDLLKDRLDAIAHVQEVVYAHLYEGTKPRVLAKMLFELLRTTIEKKTVIDTKSMDTKTYSATPIARSTAASKLETFVRETAFKNALASVAEALQACRPDGLSIPPDEDRVGVAAVEAVIGGIPHLVFVRGPTDQHRRRTNTKKDPTLHLEAEFLPRVLETLDITGEENKTSVRSALGVEDSEQPVEATPVGRDLSITTNTAAMGRSSRFGAAIIIATLVILIATFIATWHSSPSPPDPPPRPSWIRPATAVVSFRNQSGDPNDAWLATALSESVARSLAAGRTLRVVSNEEAFKLERDLDLRSAESIPPQVLERIRKRTGADTLVTGSYSVSRGAGPALVEGEVRLIDTKGGELLLTRPITGAETQIVETAIQIAAPIRQKLGIAELSAADKEEVTVSISSQQQACRLYAQGLMELRLFRAKEARDLLLRAANEDSEHPLIRLALFRAYAALGLEAQARQAITRAREVITRPGRYSEHLPSEQRSEIEAEFHKQEARFDATEDERETDWQKAIEAERSRWKPPNADVNEYGLRLAETLLAADRINEAFITTTALRRLPVPLSLDGRIDLVESRTYQAQSNFRKQVEFAVLAANKGRTTGDCMLLGEAQMLQATALLEMRNSTPATNAIAEARGCFQKIGDLGSDARAVEHTATLAFIRGDRQAEQNSLHVALNVHEQLGDRANYARVALIMSEYYVRQGDDAEAKRLFDIASETFERIGNAYQRGVTFNQRGNLLFFQGQLRAAEECYREAFESFQKLSDYRDMAIALTNIGEVLASRGDLAGARQKHDESRTINEGLPGSSPDYAGLAYDLCRIADVLALQGYRNSAKTKYDDALKIQDGREHGEPLEAAKTRIALARLLIDAGNPTEAENMLDLTKEILDVAPEKDYSYFAQSARAEALLAQGKPKEALETADGAWKAVARSKNRPLRFAVAIPRARALAASNNGRDVSAALTFLEELRREAASMGYVIVELQISLAMGHIELEAGQSSGHDRLTAVERAARAKGIGDIVRRAADRRPRREAPPGRPRGTPSPPLGG